MTQGVTFDDFNGEDVYDLRETKPFWTIQDKGDEEVLKWLNDDWINKKEDGQNRLRTYAENLALYKGIHYRALNTRHESFRNQESTTTNRNPKVVVNHIYDMVETKTSKLTKFKSNLAVLPASNDWNDKINSKTIKECIDSFRYEMNYDEFRRKYVRSALIHGDCYALVDWNDEIGEPVKDVKLAMQAKVEIGALGDQTESEFNLTRIPRIGDVEISLLTPDKVFPEKRDNWEECTHLTRIKYYPIEELKVRYPDAADRIRTDLGRKDDLYTLDALPYRNETLVKFFYHRPTEFVPKGAFIVYTEDTILLKSEWPFEDGHGSKIEDFPFVKLADIEVPNELHGRSFIRMIKQLQLHHDNLYSMSVKGHAQAALPKWMVPESANVKINSLANDITVVKYKGVQKPELVTYNTTSNDAKEFLDRSERQIEKLSGVFSVSRGTPPAGIKAGIALQFLDEQETERAASIIARVQNAEIQIAKKVVERMRQHYPKHPDRMMKILGRDSVYEIKAFDEGVFNTPHDIRMQASSALPESKALKLQSIFDLQAAFPNLLSPEQVLDILDFSQEQRFMDIATVAVKAAESENDAMIKGEEPMEPQEWEDHITHWKAHVRLLQERSFKENTTPQTQTLLISHITTTEYLMVERAKKNPLFAQKLLAIDNFPVFFVQNMMELMPQQPQAQQPPQKSPIKQAPQSVQEQVQAAQQPQM